MQRLIALFAALLWLSGLPARAEPLRWQSWSADVFEKSASQKRLVLLDLEAVWCHWCHVMDETTYADPEVQALLRQHFIIVRADQDANPDLAGRYGDWGWPATILYAPDGTEIAKLRGYRNPEQMRSILKAFIAEPTPGPSATAEKELIPAAAMFLSQSQRTRLTANWTSVYDAQNGGWGSITKFVHGGSMDYALNLAEAGDAKAAAQVRQTLDGAINLIDPVAGGIYQYSDKPDWLSPHFEKIMPSQAQNLRNFSIAAKLFDEPRYAAAAKLIARYLMTNWRGAEGAFYVSQDADVGPGIHGAAYYKLDAKGRNALGHPRIDTNLYARENGLAIAALAVHAGFSGDGGALDAAVTAAHWVIANRALPGGGFRHGEIDRGGPFLVDNLAMGQAFIELYAATGDRYWLKLAHDSGDFIGKTFRAAAGFVTSAASDIATGPLSKPAYVVEENIDAARFFNLLSRYGGKLRYRELAGHAMRSLASEAVAGSQRFLAGALLADQELSIEPVHLTIVGHRDDPAAQLLHDAAAGYPATYRRIDWWDMREGPLANPDVQYPDMGEAALFACSNQICSQPVFKAEDIAATVSRMLALRTVRQE